MCPRRRTKNKFERDCKTESTILNWGYIDCQASTLFTYQMFRVKYKTLLQSVYKQLCLFDWTFCQLLQVTLNYSELITFVRYIKTPIKNVQMLCCFYSSLKWNEKRWRNLELSYKHYQTNHWLSILYIIYLSLRNIG